MHVTYSLLLGIGLLLVFLALTSKRPERAHAGRPLEEWAFVLLRYGTAPRVAVWRPCERAPRTRELREVFLPGAGSPSAREEVSDAA